MKTDLQGLGGSNFWCRTLLIKTSRCDFIWFDKRNFWLHPHTNTKLKSFSKNKCSSYSRNLISRIEGTRCLPNQKISFKFYPFGKGKGLVIKYSHIIIPDRQQGALRSINSSASLKNVCTSLPQTRTLSFPDAEREIHYPFLCS